jgi:uncharacterized protein with GYD domain
MATFIALIDYTDRGIQAIGDSPARADAFAEQAKQAGVTIKDLYWTHGEHDGVLILDSPDDKTAAALMLSLARKGNVRTRTLRAYDRDEMEEILAKTT